MAATGSNQTLAIVGLIYGNCMQQGLSMFLCPAHIVYCLVPDSVKDSGETKLTWSIPTDQQYMKTYYQLTFPHDDFVITM